MRIRAVARHMTMLYDKARETCTLQDETARAAGAAARLPPRIRGRAFSYKRFCFDRMQRYRALKQADLVLLMTAVPRRFYERAAAQRFSTAYEPITLHDSHVELWPACAACAVGSGLWAKAEDYLRKAVYLDL